MVRTRRAWFVSLVLASSALALAPVPAGAVFLPVTKTADTNDGVCDGDCSFREAVAVANATPGADVVTVPAGTYFLTLGIVLVTEAVTINGAGRASTILDGSDTQPILAALLVPGPVEIFALRLRNGRSSTLFQGFEVAGGFSSAFGTAILTDVDVVSNEALVGKGGGLHIGGGSDTTLDGVAISGNASAVAGGGIHVGAVDSAPAANAFLLMRDTDVTSNVAPYGGGLSVIDGDVAIDGGSALVSNDATVGGGGVLVGGDAPRTRLEVRQTFIESNQAEVGGGLLVANVDDPSSVVAVYDSNIRFNDAGTGAGVAIGTSTGADNAASIRFERVLFLDNDATSSGGGIYVEDGTAVVSNSTVSGSFAVTGGGTLAVGGTLELRNVTLADNSTGSGNGTAIVTAGGTVRLLNSLVKGDCDVLGGTGGISSLGGNLESPASSCVLVGPGDQPNVANPLLGSLGSNGGVSSTYSLLDGSLAIDAGFAALCPPVDQRTHERDPACDAGSFEADSPGGALALDDLESGALGPAWEAAAFQ